MDAGVLSSQEGDGCGGCWTQKLPPRGSSARVHARHSGACAKKPAALDRRRGVYSRTVRIDQSFFFLPHSGVTPLHDYTGTEVRRCQPLQ